MEKNTRFVEYYFSQESNAMVCGESTATIFYGLIKQNTTNVIQDVT